MFAQLTIILSMLYVYRMDNIEIPKSPKRPGTPFKIPDEENELRLAIGRASEIFIKLTDIDAVNQPITNTPLPSPRDTLTIEEIDDDEIKNE